jgi:hypothetical protein
MRSTRAPLGFTGERNRNHPARGRRSPPRPIYPKPNQARPNKTKQNCLDLFGFIRPNPAFSKAYSESKLNFFPLPPCPKL